MAPYSPACGPVARLAKYFQEPLHHCLVQKSMILLMFNRLKRLLQLTTSIIRYLKQTWKSVNNEKYFLKLLSVSFILQIKILEILACLLKQIKVIQM